MTKTFLRSSVILILLCSMLAVTSCQPTPNKPIVQSKNDGKLEQKIEAAEKPPKKYIAPEKWTDSANDKSGKVTIDIDAVVSVPDTDMYPVSHVSKIEFTDKWASELLNKLSIDGKVYSIKGDLMLSKSEIAEMIQNLMNEISDPDSDINSPLISDDERAELVREKEQEIADLQEYYKTAPDEFVSQEIPVEFVNSQTGSPYFECCINMGYKTMTEIRFSAYSEQGGNVFINISDGIESGEIIRYTDDLENRNGLDMTPEKAVALGKAFIKKLNDGDFEASLIKAGYMRIGERKENVTDYPECYEIDFTRSVEGVVTTYRDDSKDFSLINDRMNEKLNRQSQFAPFLPPESIKLIITDSGVCGTIWKMPSVNVDVVNKNVELMEFDEITDIFKKQICVEGLITDVYDTNIVSRKIVINKAVLGMTQIREKNTYDGLLMVPAWNFYGYEIYTYNESQPGGYILDEKNQYVNDQLYGHSFLTINAIDGSIINPLFGY